MTAPAMPAAIDPDLTAFLDAILANAFVRAFEGGQIVSFTTHAVAGTEFSVSHSLGTPPLYYVVLNQAAAGSIYNGSTANTGVLMYFKSDAAATAFKVLLVKGDV